MNLITDEQFENLKPGIKIDYCLDVNKNMEYIGLNENKDKVILKKQNGRIVTTTVRFFKRFCKIKEMQQRS